MSGIIGIVIFAFGFLLGVGFILLMGKREKPMVEGLPKPPSKPKQSISNIRSNHLKPRYYDYNGGFANVTKCSDCGSVGLYEDQHTVNPCNICGASVYKIGSAKWDCVDGLWQWTNPKNDNL